MKTYSSVLGLREPHVDNYSLGGAPRDKYYIRLPSNVLERDGPGKLVEQATGVDSQTGERHTFGTHFEGQHLD